MRFHPVSSIISRISIVGPFLLENESGVLRAHRTLRGKNSDQRNWPFLPIRSFFFTDINKWKCDHFLTTRPVLQMFLMLKCTIFLKCMTCSLYNKFSFFNFLFLKNISFIHSIKELINNQNSFILIFFCFYNSPSLINRCKRKV